ncbi:hypothetical protein HPP92_006152 [Vanilla planifolia]|uniref:Uncharacterized protein n=1 Tax=Vanilla planifolia TaxID=51239 RepID=A0A835RJT8_VANPL|nr:hypothetical protein HPP92_006152 [Vanilla planifolia]
MFDAYLPLVLLVEPLNNRLEKPDGHREEAQRREPGYDPLPRRRRLVGSNRKRGGQGDKEETGHVVGERGGDAEPADLRIGELQLGDHADHDRRGCVGVDEGDGEEEEQTVTAGVCGAVDELEGREGRGEGGGDSASGSDGSGPSGAQQVVDVHLKADEEHEEDAPDVGAGGEEVDVADVEIKDLAVQLAEHRRPDQEPRLMKKIIQDPDFNQIINQKQHLSFLQASVRWRRAGRGAGGGNCGED